MYDVEDQDYAYNTKGYMKKKLSGGNTNKSIKYSNKNHSKYNDEEDDDSYNWKNQSQARNKYKEKGKASEGGSNNGGKWMNKSTKFMEKKRY